MPFDDKLENLSTILEGSEVREENRNRAGQLPTNQDICTLLTQNEEQDDSAESERQAVEYNELDVYVNALVVVIWIVGDIKTWYLGYVNEVKQNSERFIIEHLERVGKGSDKWRFPKKEDICEVDILQIKGIRPESSWDYTNSRAHTLVLQNHQQIDQAVRDAKVATYTD